RDPTIGSDGAKQVAGERARTRSRLDDARTGIDVGCRQDLARVLRVDHGRTAGHGHDVLAHDRPEHEVLRTGLGRHGEALFATDQCVMLDLALVREERLTRFEADVVLTPFAVGQAYPFAFGQWA